MRDFDGNEIKLVNDPNAHIMALGQSGQGKTYFWVRYLEMLSAKKVRTLILDFSDSFTDEQLEEHNFACMDNCRIIDTNNLGNFKWVSNYDKKLTFIEDLTDALINVLGITSYFQRKWIRKAMETFFQKYEVFCMPQFIFHMENLYETILQGEGTKDDLDNVKRLLSRLAPYERLFELGIMHGERSEAKGVTILRMSGMSETKKRFMTSLLLELIWKETKLPHEKRHCDGIILDEFQFLDASEDSVLVTLLREGRRFGMEVLLSTQFISNYSKEEKSALLQVGHLLLFKPVEEDINDVVKLVDAVYPTEWKSLLSGLSRGEAVLTGKYSVGTGKRILNTPVKIKI